MTGTQENFGSIDSTGKKLAIIREYLGMYQKALSSRGYFKTYYIDAFAGTGVIQTGKLSNDDDVFWLDEVFEGPKTEVSTLIEGSTQIALDIDPPFNGYIFIEKDVEKIRELQDRFSEHKNSDRVKYVHGDANEKVIKFCASMKSGDRAVVFLDPFGSQVAWSTIEAIAATKKIDLWYLFPAGLSVFRQISNKGTVHDTHAPSIDKLYGTQKWRDKFIKQEQKYDLFGTHTEDTKDVTPESAAEFMMQRMKEIFAGGVGNFKIPLGKHAYPSYYLLFAWGNPASAAKTLANKLSNAAIKASDNKDGRSLRN